MVAAELSRRLDKPWVADLRDPWALDEMRVYPTRLHRQLEQRQMRRLLSTAAAVVTTTEEAVERMHARFPELARTPIVSIPNGFDRNDFSDPPPPRDGEAFRIVHTGYLHTDLGTGQRRAVLLRRLLGGGYGADILTRSHAYLLQAIELLLVRRPDLRTKLELHLAGVLSPTDHELAQDSQVVREHGYLRHGDAVELMRSADLLFLPMQNLPTGVRSGIVPGKTYEYLAAGRPILAAIPEGDARDILAEAAIARICDPDDVPAMMAAVEAEFECRRLREPLPTVPSALLERFERHNLADRYATLLASVAGLRAPAGRAAIA
jgi:glycosyltransferase involved in cell wall biosynthesis